MRTWLAIILACLPTASLGQSTEPKFADWMRARTIDAVTISYLAERLCGDLYVEATLAVPALNYYGYRSWADLPREQIERFMKGFDRDLSGACAYAWGMYGIGSGGAYNPSLRMIRRAIRSPFSEGRR